MMNDLYFTFSVDKPVGPTSRDVVNIVSSALGIKKVGHGGTLDPLACGVLVIAVGRSETKKLFTHVEAQKEYAAEITLGQTSATDDGEGEKVQISNFQLPTTNEVKKTLEQFVGEIEQTPPLYSAVKIKGKSAYKYAREGKAVELKPRIARIDEIELIDYDFSILKIKVVCGKGVYIRSLARDIGEKLETGAYMSGLIRTRVGEYTLDKSVQLEDLDEFLQEKLNNSPGV